MATAFQGRNLAVTKDGTKYNKLSRPDDLSDLIPPSPSAAPSMNSAKRKLKELDPVHASADEEPDNKRVRPSELSIQQDYYQTTAATPKRESIINTRKSIKPRLPARNERYGQAQGIGSGLDDWDDGDVTDESMNEAMQYLRSVRQEADAIPILISVPASGGSEGELEETIDNNGFGDSRAIFKDGVCIAARSDSSPPATDMIGRAVLDIPPQEGYRAMLMKRLGGARESMTGLPPSDALDRLQASSKAPTTFPRLNRATVITWTPILKYTNPTPAQLSQISQPAILHLIAATMECLKPNRNITPQLSCWIWGIFVRLGERGTLQADDEYTVRELGKAAVAMRLSYLGYAVDGPSLNLDESDIPGEDSQEPDTARESEQRHDSESEDGDGRLSNDEDQDVVTCPRTKDMFTSSLQPPDRHAKPQPTLPRSDSASEDGEIPEDGPSTIIDSVESAKDRLLSSIVPTSPKPERGSNVTKLTQKERKRAEKARKKRAYLRKKAEKAKRAAGRTSGGTNGSLASDRSTYDRDRFVSATPQSETRRSVSTAHTTNNGDRVRRQRRNTSSPESSPDRVLAKRNMSSPESSPGPYRRLRRVSPPVQRSFASRAEAEANRARRTLDRCAMPQLVGADSSDSGVVNSKDHAVVSADQGSAVEDVVMGQDKGKEQLEEGKVAEDEEVPNMNTLATLDMIITIVGERYGQRDLLEARKVWEHAMES